MEILERIVLFEKNAYFFKKHSHSGNYLFLRRCNKHDVNKYKTNLDDYFFCTSEKFPEHEFLISKIQFQL